MQSAVVMFARKSPPRPASQPVRRTRRSLLARLRDDITIMRQSERHCEYQRRTRAP